MVNPKSSGASAKLELANRLFFRLYQCANMLHKTGSRAVEAEGLTTQQWAVLGALSRDRCEGGMSIGELARYLMVSRQNLSGLISRMERELNRFAGSNGVTMQLKRTEPRRFGKELLPYAVDVVGLDQPGVVHSLSGFFAARKVEIGEVSTRSYAATHTGG